MKPSSPLLSLASRLAVFAAFISCKALAVCPPLDGYYPAAADQWPEKAAALQDILPLCLDSAEFFALLGAAYLNTGQLNEALEALERSLLQDPASGAAQLDYAQALYLSGQLFAALELNLQILSRPDLPTNARVLASQRQAVWGKSVSRSSLTAELSLGFDTNLNGAPSNGELVLTLSGEQVILNLDPQFQALEGGFANVRLVASSSTVGPERRRDWLGTFRNRSSQNHESDINQLDLRFGDSRQWERFEVDVMAGASHMMYGGSGLYSVGELRSRLKFGHERCQPLVEVAGQYQHYHGQQLISGTEAGLFGGLQCALPENQGYFDIQAGALVNKARQAGRPGGDRQGWRVQASWQQKVGPGVLSAAGSYGQLEDERGYSELIQSGATRRLYSSTFNLQFAAALKPRLQLFASYNYQQQNSNLSPFVNSGTAVELGLIQAFK